MIGERESWSLRKGDLGFNEEREDLFGLVGKDWEKKEKVKVKKK